MLRLLTTRQDSTTMTAMETVSLPAEINAATRSLHTTLNHLITSRLPLALPPYAPVSSHYAAGLAHFAHIFITFESLWAELTAPAAQAPADTDTTTPPFSPLLSYLLVNPYDAPALFTSTLGAPTPPSPQLAALLRMLRPRGLARSLRLKRDLEYLLGLPPAELEGLLVTAPAAAVAAFCTHIRKSVHEKPWTLVSYAWCFYMAVFSGGRWIRASLLRAPADFWPSSDDGAALSERGLSFWHFLGAHDGEDIKTEFKTRLAAAEDLFTPDERIDIIEEAKHIFRLCATLIDELDLLVGSQSMQHLQSHTDVAVDQPPLSPNGLEKIPAAHPRAKSSPLAPEIEQGVSAQHTTKPATSATAWTSFVRRIDVIGTLVVLACLVFVALHVVKFPIVTCPHIGAFYFVNCR